jgi:hypothetical protein
VTRPAVIGRRQRHGHFVILGVGKVHQVDIAPTLHDQNSARVRTWDREWGGERQPIRVLTERAQGLERHGVFAGLTQVDQHELVLVHDHARSAVDDSPLVLWVECQLVQRLVERVGLFDFRCRPAVNQHELRWLVARIALRLHATREQKERLAVDGILRSRQIPT